MKQTTIADTATGILQQLIKFSDAQIKKIAEKMDITRPTLYRYLDEPERFSPEQLDILAKEIGITREVLDKILSGKIDTFQRAIKDVN